MHWATAYLGKPWRLGADGPDAFDCWGLVRAVLRERAGLDLQPIVIPQSDQRGIAKAFEGHAELADWTEQPVPRELDAVLMAQARHPIHVGLWVYAGGLRILHARQGSGVVAQDPVSLRRHGYHVLSTWRHRTLA